MTAPPASAPAMAMVPPASLPTLKTPTTSFPESVAPWMEPTWGTDHHCPPVMSCLMSTPADSLTEPAEVRVPVGAGAVCSASCFASHRPCECSPVIDLATQGELLKHCFVVLETVPAATCCTAGTGADTVNIKTADTGAEDLGPERADETASTEAKAVDFPAGLQVPSGPLGVFWGEPDKFPSVFSISAKNQTSVSVVTEFVLVGFLGLQPEHYNLVAAVFLSIYVTVVVSNSVFVLLFVIEPRLQKPMYIIMMNLALVDIGFCTVVLPKIVSRYFFNDSLVSFHVCMFQRLLIHYFANVNFLVMTTMALDRYLAICFPLRYPVLMTNRTMILLNGFSWTVSMIIPAFITTQMSQMPFCGPNRIIHCFCDTMFLYSLVCSNVSSQSFVFTSLVTSVISLTLLVIMFFYSSIVVSVIRMANNHSRAKAFSTCATQLCIICIHYVPRFFVLTSPYLPNVKFEINQRIAFTLVYWLIPPLVNPFMYFFRTKEIRHLFQKWCFCAQRNGRRHRIRIFSVSK
ncbi:olfactory receptor 11A1-like [Salminus brasiliensis]|uniref:olfactory receptor 11A1-like n=1 Tax=Salminus brasiliensis TaxID=930266 RepID=UPI003B82E46A